MTDTIKEVSRYVSMRLSRWESSAAESRTKAELAQLRRCAGKKPGELPELWGVLFEDLPEDLMSRNGEPTRAEWAIATALSLYALHQQGSEIGNGHVYQQGSSLGKAVRLLAKNDDDLDRVRRKFNICATSADIQECAHYLRGIVQLLRAENIPLDYPALARDLYLFQTVDGAASVKLRWGQDFYRYVSKNEEDKENEE